MPPLGALKKWQKVADNSGFSAFKDLSLYLYVLHRDAKMTHMNAMLFTPLFTSFTPIDMNLPTINIRMKNKAPDKNGKVPIIINVTYQSKVMPVSTGLKVKPGDFDKHKLISNEENAILKNRQLRSRVSELEYEFLRLAESGKLSLLAVKAVISGGKPGALTFMELKNIIKRKYTGLIAARTLKYWDTAATKLEECFPEIRVSQLNKHVMQDYEKHKAGEHNNTTWGDIKNIMSILNKAVEHEVITENPLASYKKPKYIQSQRSYLTDKEINKLQTYVDNAANQKAYRKVGAYYLFAIDSGFRYQDLARYDEQRLVRENRLYFTDHKTGTPHYIPIYPELKKSIERLRLYDKIPANQVCNRFLKEIAIACNIEHKLTMHMARHTFAVQYLNRKGSLEVLQKLMGHKNVKVTAIYGQITDQRIDEEAKRVWG